MRGAAAVSEQRKKFTVDDVMRMLETGVLSEDDRLELLDGDLYLMSPQDPHHASTVTRLSRALHEAYRGRGHWVIRTQLPLQVPPLSLPEPDLAVVRGTEATFDDRHPGAADAALVVEVSDSSDAEDLRKAAIYARGGLALYWRISLRRRQLEVHESPVRGHYRVMRILEATDKVSLPGLRGRSLLVGSVLPARKRAR
jgi:Uma2 family endonuclease